MKYCKITKPIGLEDVCGEIEKICSEAHVYKQCGLRPPHLAIQLDSGSGRTTILEYMTDCFSETGVLDFNRSLDDYIELTFDGTLQQLKQSFNTIDSAAVYTNGFCNIVGMDISAISQHLGEVQCTEFLKKL